MAEPMWVLQLVVELVTNTEDAAASGSEGVERKLRDGGMWPSGPGTERTGRSVELHKNYLSSLLLISSSHPSDF